jgi:hypothetical protein
MQKLGVCGLVGAALVACGNRTDLVESAGTAFEGGTARDATIARPSVADASGSKPRATGMTDELDATFDAGSCVAQPTASLCEVSNGATVNADGSVTGGTERCEPLCGPSQYELVCSGVDPDPSLGCRIIPIPTPSCCLYYCCPSADR